MEKTMRSALNKFILCAGLRLLNTPVFADITKLSSDLVSLLANPLGTSNVVIQFKTAPSLLDLLQITSLGGGITNHDSSLPAVAALLPNAVVLTVSDFLNVAYSPENRFVAAKPDYSAAAVNASVAQQY